MEPLHTSRSHRTSRKAPSRNASKSTLKTSKKYHSLGRRATLWQKDVAG